MTTLLRQHDFRALRVGSILSQFAARMITFGLPLLAVEGTHATAWQVGLISTLATVAFAVIGLPAGAIVDRMRQRRLLAWSDAGRALLVAALAVPFVGTGLGAVYVVAVGTGVLSVFFDVAHASYLPKLIGRDDLVAGNSALTAVSMVAWITGPVVAGATITLVGPRAGMVVIALAFLASAGCVLAIRAGDPAPTPAPVRHLGREIREGLLFVVRDSLLRRILTAGALYNLCTLVMQALITVRLVVQLGLSATTAGVFFAAGGVGGVIGSVFAKALADRFGQQRIIGLSLLVTSPFTLLIPAISAGSWLWLAVLGNVVGTFGSVVFNVAQLSVRQRSCPDELLGRMNATMRFVLWGAIPLGALLGSAIAAVTDVRTALWVGAVGMVLSGLPIIGTVTGEK
jgi:MFS family permease